MKQSLGIKRVKWIVAVGYVIGLLIYNMVDPWGYYEVESLLLFPLLPLGYWILVD